jgi:hypothetical protein
MFIFNEVNGGFGTTVFRYLASAMIGIMYDGTPTTEISETTHIITDDFFIEWMDKLAQLGEIEDINGELFRRLASPKIYHTELSMRYISVQERLMFIASKVVPHLSPPANDPVIMKIFDDIMTVSDEVSEHFDSSNIIKSNKIQGVIIKGTFQHDTIYNIYKPQILQWIKYHSKDVIMSGDFFKFYPEDLIAPIMSPHSNVVIHIQLGEYIKAGRVAHPFSLISALQQANSSKITLVSRAPKSYIEKLYLKFIIDRYDTSVILCDSEMDEFNHIRNAKTIVSSLSPTCWAATYFSDIVETVYFPDCHYKFPNQTFGVAIEKTILFEFKQISQSELDIFFETVDVIPNRINLSPIVEDYVIPENPVYKPPLTALSRISPPVGSKSRRGMTMRR